MVAGGGGRWATSMFAQRLVHASARHRTPLVLMGYPLLSCGTVPVKALCAMPIDNNDTMRPEDSVHTVRLGGGSPPLRGRTQRTPFTPNWNTKRIGECDYIVSNTDKCSKR